MNTYKVVDVSGFDASDLDTELNAQLPEYKFHSFVTIGALVLAVFKTA
jgi:hypothetical protein